MEDKSDINVTALCFQLSALSFLLFAFGFQLSALSFLLFAFGFQLFAFSLLKNA